MNKAILLVNVGTPDSPGIRDVRKYLSQFLNDPYVINIPWLWRKMLVNGIIVPFRARRSAALYRQLWTANGSPLRHYLERVRTLLQKQLDDRTDVWAAMSYGYPNITEVMKAMREKGYQQVTIVPLFPHYAVSTTGSVEAHVMKQIADWPAKPELTIVRQFYHDPLFLNAWISRIKAYHPEKYHHIVFSFHSLPLSHLPEKCRQYYRAQRVCECLQQSETPDIHSAPARCYGVACYDMANRLASRLGLENEKYTVAFQSKMSDYWLQPFTDQTLKALASKGTKVLVVAPSFVADCLETSVELGIECRDLFIENGGSEFTLVESLNDQPEWIEALKKISGRNIR